MKVKVKVLFAVLSWLALLVATFNREASAQEFAHSRENRPFLGDFSVDSALLDGSAIPFVAHVGNGPFDSYLSLELNFQSAQELKEQLEQSTQQKLNDRSEAHITVITPIEFDRGLKKFISIDEINALAKERLQKSRFQMLCIGRGQAVLDEARQSTFYIVVKSDELVHIRQEIAELFVSRGGNKAVFNATHYYPHITIGFTIRDLHEDDGVIKDVRSCVGGLYFKPRN